MQILGPLGMYFDASVVFEDDTRRPWVYSATTY